MHRSYCFNDTLRVCQSVFLTAILFFPIFSITVFAIDVQIGSEAAQIGSTGRVDIALNDAAGIASAEFTVNYDPSVLELVMVTNQNCSLGTNFTIASSVADGSAKIVLVREDGLASGQGEIASLYFNINPGAKNGMNTEIVVAQCQLGGEFGVDLAGGAESIASTNGKLWAVESMEQDSNSNGIPDWWEARHFDGLTNAVAEADDDGDGASNWHEFHAGTDPRRSADVLRLLALGRAPVGGHVELKWASIEAKKYDVERSTNLMAGFDLLETNLEATAAEFIYSDTTATNDTPYYYRIKVRE